MENRFFETAKEDVYAKIEAAKKEGVTYPAVLHFKAQAQEIWSFFWMMTINPDEETVKKLKNEWDNITKEFDEILATK